MIVVILFIIWIIGYGISVAIFGKIMHYSPNAIFPALVWPVMIPIAYFLGKIKWSQLT
jgi:hypothetical protein